MTRNKIEELTDKARKKGTRAKEWSTAEGVRSTFLERLRNLSILDPACGSGNFLYLALQAVKDVEHLANQECETLGLPPRIPMVGPEILHGIEINPLAAELAKTSIWIGDIQWGIKNGIHGRGEPILRQLETVEHRDALLDRDGSEAEWPEAEFIVGNPPFLGGKLLRRSLGNDRVEALFRAYKGRVPQEADLVTYWFEKARKQMAGGLAKRVGFVATNSIRGGANRKVLESASRDFPIYEAWSDEPWIVEGASVRVSLTCLASQSMVRRLNGRNVLAINNDLSCDKLDLTKARRLPENAGIAFMGNTKGGPFDIDGNTARQWLSSPLNPNGRPNSDVLKPWINGLDVARRPRDMWIIDFGLIASDNEAAYYEKPFEYALRVIKPTQIKRSRAATTKGWWQHERSRPAMLNQLSRLKRYIATPTIAKHRFFVWVDARICPDHQLIAICRDDDVAFGVLHSRFHEAWSLLMGTSLEDRPRYTPTTTFETFPFPPDQEEKRMRPIVDASRKLAEARIAWLFPSDLIERKPEAASGYPDRILPRNAGAEAILRTRTMTKLYNERPQWLVNLHEELDAAVAAAYGWSDTITSEDALSRLLELNLCHPNAPLQ